MMQLHNARLYAGVFILTLLAACSTPQTSALLKAQPERLEQRAELREVPYFAQDAYQCGPASLAMVLNHGGLDTSPAQLQDSLYIPDKQGSLQVEMLAAARRQGFLAYPLRPQLQDVLDEIDAGNPVIVLQNLSLPWYPVWHYAVVIGYDLHNREIILRSGAEQRLLLPLTTFEHTWARSQYWAMLALPPARIPQTANAEDYVRSLAALQHSNKGTDLAPAYDAAQRRWPHDLTVAIAAGNDAYEHGKLDLAAQIFSAATRQHPNAATAFNNLAQTLSDQGKLDEALRTIQHAVSLGGPLQDILRQTQAEIERKKRAAESAAIK